MRCIRDVPKTSHKRRLFRNVLERYLKCLKKDIFLEIHLRSLKDVAWKTSFLRYIWDVSKTSPERRLFWDVSEMSLRCLSQRRPNWDVSETSHAGWVTTLTFHVCFSSIYEFKSPSFFILAIYNPGDSYKVLQRQKIQARGNKFMAKTKTNKNIGVKIKTKRQKGLYVMTIQLLSLSGGLSYRISSNNRPFGIKRPSNKEHLYPVSFL